MLLVTIKFVLGLCGLMDKAKDFSGIVGLWPVLLRVSFHIESEVMVDKYNIMEFWPFG